MKKPPQKVAYLYDSCDFFSLCSPACPKQCRTSYPFYKFFYPSISCRISALNICAHMLAYAHHVCILLALVYTFVLVFEIDDRDFLCQTLIFGKKIIYFFFVGNRSDTIMYQCGFQTRQISLYTTTSYQRCR